MMKRYWFALLLTALLLPPLAAQMTIPRVYVQRLVLDDGSKPFVTWEKDKSAPEYHLRAWILERPEEIMDSDEHSIHHLTVKQVGNGEKVPFMVVCQVNLGNFPSQWQEGENLHLELTCRETGEQVAWDVYIPEGSALIKMLDTPQVIPPQTVKKDKSTPKKPDKDKAAPEKAEQNSPCHGCPSSKLNNCGGK